MNALWTALLPAIAAGVFGIGGVLLGRRQTTDQAEVEHGQWLRGQRLEAYVQFLEAWEEALADYQNMQDTWDAYTDANPIYQAQNGEEMIFGAVSDRTHGFIVAVRPLRERVQILGPARVETAASVLHTTLVELRQELLARPHETGWDHFDELMS
ncbi:hypothetical protein EOT10_40620 [Streptomyces antnestii]|uniref:Uncharacterized protein n=1 Tax=Streptomyces antnestii TaxID=2494256 RepID=A0A3S2VK01_9ACTN|nr:hypothetical protein [Streptomyces sp. San01]RVU14599.1 hypothetical protein EOT10_40620 [Streptomyces sp. San01]